MDTRKLTLPSEQDAVDIEVSIQDEGAMNIGVFGSYEKLGEKGAKGLVVKLVDALENKMGDSDTSGMFGAVCSWAYTYIRRFIWGA